jgi:tetratricopeptide (TPR) repeat protein
MNRLFLVGLVAYLTFLNPIAEASAQLSLQLGQMATPPASSNTVPANPIGWIQITIAVAERFSSQNLITTINKRGIAFYFDRLDVEILRALGATDGVIQALQNARLVPNFDRVLGASKYEYLADEEQQVRALAVKQPDNVAFHLVLFRLLDREGKSRESMSEARRAVQSAPGMASAHFALGVALFGDKKPDESLVEIRQAVKLMPDSMETHLILGFVLQSSGNLDGASAEYTVASHLDEKTSLPHEALGHLYSSKDINRSIAEYRQAVQQQPDDANLRVTLGNALSQKHDVDGGIAEFRAALRLMPDNEKAHLGLGNSLDQENQHEEALKELREAVRLAPQDSIAHADLASGEAAAGDLDGAIREFQEALRIDPSNSDAKQNLDSARRTKSAERAQNAAVAVPHSAQTADVGPTLPDTMQFIQSKLNGIGQVDYVASGQESGSNWSHHFKVQASKIVADPSGCQVSYHLTIQRDGSGQRVSLDNDYLFFLRNVESIVVMPVEQGYYSAKVDPQVFVLKVNKTDKDRNEFFFLDDQLANRVGKAMVHAVELCGGGSKSEPF